jgi:hypothetical protein
LGNEESEVLGCGFCFELRRGVEPGLDIEVGSIQIKFKFNIWRAKSGRNFFVSIGSDRGHAAA